MINLRIDQLSANECRHFIKFLDNKMALEPERAGELSQKKDMALVWLAILTGDLK